jgi:uncharacterized membrane protein YeaQ/YmgE (transglycosylase-associated protein family)
VLIVAFIVIGMVAGAIAQWLLRPGRKAIDWTEAFVAGIAGSFVFGAIASLLAGEGLELRISGLLGSIIGAIIVLAVWYPMKARFLAQR